MNLEVRPLDASRESDFWAIHSEANGEGWCCCAAWWAPTWEGWGQRAAAENRALRQKIFEEGRHDGFLLYADGRPAGWCQCGPRDRLEKLRAQYALTPDPEAWAVTCFVVLPAWRRAGMAHRLLAGVLEELRRRGVKRVQGFPKRGEGLEDGEVWTGPELVFVKAGFALERDDPRRPIYGLNL